MFLFCFKSGYKADKAALELQISQKRKLTITWSETAEWRLTEVIIHNTVLCRAKDYIKSPWSAWTYKMNEFEASRCVCESSTPEGRVVNIATKPAGLKEDNLFQSKNKNL